MDQDGPLMISPKYSAADWFALTFQSESDWKRAVEILRDRLEGRFVKFIDIILPHETSGFAVLALDAALVETLEQFRAGLVETPYRQGKQMFVRFLTETAFRDSFTPELASRFYSDIRNGLLHQAESRALTRIRRDTGAVVSATPDGRGMTVNPVLFHKKLKEVFETYCRQLLDSKQDALRLGFRTKMDSICNVRLARGHLQVA